MNISRWLAAAALITLVIGAAPTAAQIELRFSPPDQRVEVGEGGSLSVMLDDVLDVRTIELWISYDPALVTSEGGQPGQLFSDSGCPLFPFFDEDDPGSWYGGSVTMGPDCFLTEPGELYRWNFTGLAEGTCPVQVDSVVLYNPLAEVIEGVTLEETTIIVGSLSSANTLPAQILTLALSPNPFNPRTTIRFGGRPDETATVEVFDLGGRRLATLWSGKLGQEPGVVQWDGTDQLGRSVPGGSYLFRIFSKGDRQVTRKGLLLK